MSTPSSEGSQKPIRFLVLATDGLWDELSNAEVVSLVAGHFQGLKGNIRKSDLPSLVPTTIGEASGIDGKSVARQESKARVAQTGSWAFKDQNLSAHLIRNAFGGADEGHLRRLLSIPAPLSRRSRDDVTVTVVWWQEGGNKDVNIEKVKAKL
jgi:pyruvate dehydrogenase phosphatase